MISRTAERAPGPEVMTADGKVVCMWTSPGRPMFSFGALCDAHDSGDVASDPITYQVHDGSTLSDSARQPCDGVDFPLGASPQSSG